MIESEKNKKIESDNNKKVSNETTCPSCNLIQSTANKICDKCGKSISSEKIKPNLRNRRKLKSGSELREKSANRANINDGRILILIVSVITFALYLFDIHIVNLLLMALRLNSDFLAEESDQTLFKILNLIPLGLGFVYLGLFFWSFKNIFGALLFTLILYLLETSLVLTISKLPHPLSLILKAVIIFFLALSIKTYMKVQKEEENDLES